MCRLTGGWYSERKVQSLPLGSEKQQNFGGMFRKCGFGWHGRKNLENVVLV